MFPPSFSNLSSWTSPKERKELIAKDPTDTIIIMRRDSIYQVAQVVATVASATRSATLSTIIRTPRPLFTLNLLKRCLTLLPTLALEGPHQKLKAQSNRKL
jgi:hypothetical protein